MGATEDAQLMELFHHDTSLKNHKKKNEEPYVKTDICLDCEQPIPKERKEKVPNCERCVRCQALHEERERAALQRR